MNTIFCTWNVGDLLPRLVDLRGFARSGGRKPPENAAVPEKSPAGLCRKRSNVAPAPLSSWHFQRALALDHTCIQYARSEHA